MCVSFGIRAKSLPASDSFVNLLVRDSASWFDETVREDDYAAFNAAYVRWFSDRFPSRTCVGTTGLAVGARVEIDWVCWRGDGWGSR